MTLNYTSHLSSPLDLIYRLQRSSCLLPLREDYILRIFDKEYNLWFDRPVIKLLGHNSVYVHR